MKRLICLLVLTIMVVVLPAKPVFSLANPAGVSEVYRDNGEDHPWGGEGHYNGGGSALQGEIDFGGGFSGYLSVDAVNYFFGFFFDKFAQRDDGRVNAYVIVTTVEQTKPEEPTRPTNRNGN